ncbi:MAG: ATP-dependent DNA ligase, partial [Alphaproteobacteria bacterium]|nr:ATP-dependent DNA ligase [Alphaproteobacteria bacterium]
MALPLPLSYPPMEAESQPALPEGPAWQYEPKWDGFRCLAFRDGGTVELRSKSGQPLGRYFPDVAAALLLVAASRFVLDGELVILVDGAPSFEELQLRLHPAASRVAKLAAAHPAHYRVFDLLVDDHGRDLTGRPLAERRAALERLVPKLASPAVALSPIAREVAVARRWLEGLQAGQDGVVAKRSDLPYRSGLRDGMVKVKRRRTADCVVGGFRYLKNRPLVGSLLLGLYDDEGRLDHVGFTATIPQQERTALTRRLEQLAGGPGFTGRAPGGPSRWSTEKTADWQPLRPELVVEVQYDHVSGGRFRHGTTLLRF